MNKTIAAAILALVVIVAAPAVAQGPCSARGTVLDSAGNPIEGAVVTFQARANPANKYPGTTNKKGKYYIAGLYTGKEDDRWDITFEKEGYVPVRMVVESRNAQKVLVGDLDQKLSPGQKIPDFTIRPLGEVMVDLTVITQDQLPQIEAQAAAGSASTATPEGQAAAASQKDPWDEAVSLAASGDLAGSLPPFQKSIEARPEDPERHEAYAKVLYQLDRFSEARVEASKAVELVPDRLTARMVLYSVFVGLEDLEQASATLDAARKLAPEDTRVLEQVAYVATRANQIDRAIAAYEEITRLDPQKADAWLALGGLQAKAGQLDRSEAAYRKVVELNPGEAYQTFYNLGVLIMNRANRSEADTARAIEAFKRAVEIKPDYAPAYQQLGLALLGTGDQPGARAAIESYLKLKPKAPDAGQMQALIQALQK